MSESAAEHYKEQAEKTNRFNESYYLMLLALYEQNKTIIGLLKEQL